MARSLRLGRKGRSMFCTAERRAHSNSTASRAFCSCWRRSNFDSRRLARCNTASTCDAQHSHTGGGEGGVTLCSGCHGHASKTRRTCLLRLSCFSAMPCTLIDTVSTFDETLSILVSRVPRLLRISLFCSIVSACHTVHALPLPKSDR